MELTRREEQRRGLKQLHGGVSDCVLLKQSVSFDSTCHRPVKTTALPNTPITWDLTAWRRRWGKDRQVSWDIFIKSSFHLLRFLPLQVHIVTGRAPAGDEHFPTPALPRDAFEGLRIPDIIIVHTVGRAS